MDGGKLIFFSLLTSLGLHGLLHRRWCEVKKLFSFFPFARVGKQNQRQQKKIITESYDTSAELFSLSHK